MDAFLAEQEKQDHFGHNLRRNKHVKINRASILQNTKEELEMAEAEEKAYIAKVRQEEEEAFLAKEKAEEDARKAEEEAKKAEEENKKAEIEAKKAAKKAEEDAKKAAKKAEEDAKKAEIEAKKAAKKAEPNQDVKKDSGMKEQIKKIGGLFAMNKDDSSKASGESDEASETDTTDNADLGNEKPVEESKISDEKAATSPMIKVNPYLIRVNTDERIMITKQTFRIGKSVVADYTITGNGAISRIHAIITGKNGEYFIKDNKSTNHTFVNGESVEDGESAQLTNDCKIVLGDEEFVFKL